VHRTGTTSVRSGDTLAGWGDSVQDNCEIPVEDVWIIHHRLALKKQFAELFGASRCRVSRTSTYGHDLLSVQWRNGIQTWRI